MILSKSKPIKIPQNVNLTHHHQYKTFPSRKPRPKNSQKPTSTKRTKPPKPTPFQANLKEIQDPNEALSLFQTFHQTGYKHDYPSYSSLIYKLAKSRHFEAIETLLGYIKQHNLRCNETLFIALFQHYGKANLVDKAIELYHKMGSFNCVRTLQSFNYILNVLVDNGRLFDANVLFERRYKLGFRLNSVPFNVMIKGLLENNEWDRSLEVFEEMLEKGIEPSVVTYNSLIGNLCKRGELEKGNELFADMVEKGKKPNAITYALLMEGLCDVGEFKEAKKLMFDMEYRGCKPGLVNFSVLMNDLCKRGKIDDAKSMLLEMKKRRFKPDVATYNMLINYLCKEDRVADGYKILFEMQIGGCEANAATYRMLLDGFCRVQDFEGGLRVLNAMLLCKHYPRIETFRSLVVGLVTSENFDGACFALKEMENRNMSFDLEGWEAVVKDCCVEDGGVSKLLNELISAVRSTVCSTEVIPEVL